MENTSQMTDVAPGEASSSPREEDKHPLLQKDINIANFDNIQRNLHRRTTAGNHSQCKQDCLHPVH
jgi:hypothetical protein